MFIFAKLHAYWQLMKPTVNNLHKLEDLFRNLSYVVRYEKGNFHSGHCIVHNRKVIVVNKFLSDKVKILILNEIIKSISFEVEKTNQTVTSEEE